MKRLLVHLIRDERGQDLVEYALLTSIVGLAGIAAFPIIEQAIATTFGSWNTATNNLWESPDPAGP